MVYIPATTMGLLDGQDDEPVVTAPATDTTPPPDVIDVYDPTTPLEQPAAPTQAEGMSALGQDVAAATGTAYKDIGKPPEGGRTAQPGYDATAVGSALGGVRPEEGLGFVDADKSTVSGQLSSLFAEESPYLQQARLAGERQAAGRGMLNTSMAAGASQAQAIQAALPIAQQDASTYAQAQNLEQQAYNAQTQAQTEGIVSGEMTAQKAAINQKAQDIQNQFQAQMQGASEENKVMLQDMQNQFNAFTQEMDQAQQSFLADKNISAEKAAGIRTQASNIMQNYQISVENLMTDPDFQNLGGVAMNNAINQMQQLAKNSIGFLGASSAIDMDPFIDAYLADLDVVDDNFVAPVDEA